MSREIKDSSRKSKLALQGVKVIDFTQATLGPITTRNFSINGATVIKVETHTRPENSRTASPFKDNISGIDRGAGFANWNSSKYGISLNLKKPKGREIALKLISWADIVCENFAPGTMTRLGLDYENAKKVKTDIIYWSQSQLGQTGPYRSYRGYGNQTTALSGIVYISGWPDREPSPPHGPYTDYVAPYFAVAAILAALDYRRRTGRGVYLDQSQLESTLQFLAPIIMNYYVDKSIMERNGNRQPNAAPHGVYQCVGEDRWVAIGVFSEEEWGAFSGVIGNPGWVKDVKFATLEQRKKNEDELDKLIEDWTVEHTAEEIERLMQVAGVCANVVENAKDLFEDPQLKHRQHFQYLEHPVIGLHAYEAPAYRLSKTPFQMRPGPCLGQHNEYVYKDIIGLSDKEIADLLIEGVITTDADLPDFKAQV